MVQYTDHNPETQLNTNIIREPDKYNTMVQYTDHNPETQLNTNIIREPHKYNTMVQYTDHKSTSQCTNQNLNVQHYTSKILILRQNTQILFQKMDKEHH